jgi:hypothetical protein
MYPPVDEWRDMPTAQRGLALMLLTTGSFGTAAVPSDWREELEAWAARVEATGPGTRRQILTMAEIGKQSKWR